MQTAQIRLYSLGFGNVRTYIMAFAFVAANIVLPQLCHMVPQGGATWLPIYFFTLVGAYKYGWKVGLLTALASPLVNSLLFGMPVAAALPAITLKSSVLAVLAGFAAARFRHASLALLAVVVAGYQIIGTLGEWAMCGSLSAAMQDFRIGLPGMLLQIFAGWFILNRILRQ